MSFIEKALEKTRLATGQGAAPVSGPWSPSPAGGPVPLRAPAEAPAPAPPAAASAAAPAVTPPRVPSRHIAIDTARLCAEGMLAPAEAQRRHAAQLRGVKRHILKALRKDPSAEGRIVMITSSLAGEGKTFTSVNLALSMAAEKDHRVLLVDGDVAKPRISALFGLANAPGLLDAALDPAVDVEDYVVGTDLPRLDVLPAGNRSADATEHLASLRMREVIAALSAVPNRIVLLDSPPLLITTEAAALAQHAGQVILVVRASLTPERAVLDSIHHLGERAGVSLLLNDVTETGLDTLYYGYGQDYGHAPAAEAVETPAPVSGTPRDA